MTDAAGKLVSITHTGSAPLPVGTNEVAMAAGLLDVGDTVPDSAFIDQNNRRRSFSEWKGTPTLVTFIYTTLSAAEFLSAPDAEIRGDSARRIAGSGAQGAIQARLGVVRSGA